jgi:hypothetical protein
MSNLNKKTDKLTLSEILARSAGVKRPAVEPAPRATWGLIAESDRTDEAVALLLKYHNERTTASKNKLEATLSIFRKNHHLQINDDRFRVLAAPKPLATSLKQNDVIALLQDFGAHAESALDTPTLPFTFNYQPRPTTPLDDFYWYLTLSRAALDIRSVALDNVYVEPALTSMIAKIRDTKKTRDGVLAKQLQDSKRMLSAKLWFDKELVMQPTAIKSFKAVSLRPKANPGSPYNQMKRHDQETPVSQIQQVLTDDWAYKDFTGLIKLIASDNGAKQFLANHKLHYTFQMAAGNTKVTTDSELKQGKPNRAIFNSPLFLRAVGGAFSQTYDDNVSHPGYLTRFSWAYGGAARFLGMISARMQALKGVRVDEDYSWDFQPMSPRKLQDLGLDDDGAAFWSITTVRADNCLPMFAFSKPDVKHWDLTRPPVYSDHLKERHLRYLKGSATPDKSKAIWGRLIDVIRHVHKLGRVQTNNKVVFYLPGQTMSGSNDTYRENTDGNLTGRIFLMMNVWESFHPGRDFEQFEADWACGDDLLACTLQRDVKLLEATNDALTPKIGQIYKPETLAISNDLSEGPFLGRMIVAIKYKGELGIVAVRPWRAITASLQFPKRPPPPAVSPFSYALVRLSACWDEAALFYPRLRQVFERYWARLLLKGARWPTQAVSELHDADLYFADSEGNPVALSETLRNLDQLWFLHTGQEAHHSEEEYPDEGHDAEAATDPDLDAFIDGMMADFDHQDLTEATPSNSNEGGLLTPPPIEPLLDTEGVDM